MKPVDEEARLFSSMRMAEEWLTDNGFIYGQRRFFNYPTGDKEWFHKDDISAEYVNVVITEMKLDDQEESKFKNLAEIHKEWLPKFLKELEETELDVEEGQRKGMEEGIQIFIEDNLEEGVPEERIRSKLQKRFGLSEEKAAEYYGKFAPKKH